MTPYPWLMYMIQTAWQVAFCGSSRILVDLCTPNKKKDADVGGANNFHEHKLLPTFDYHFAMILDEICPSKYQRAMWAAELSTMRVKFHTCSMHCQ